MWLLVLAGTKDKRGVTCQFATIWKVPPARLAGLNQRCVIEWVIEKRGWREEGRKGLGYEALVFKLYGHLKEG